jgi:uncharacterized protein VirK/YbjX
MASGHATVRLHDVVGHLFWLVRAMHPEWTLRGVKKRVSLFAQGLADHAEVERWLGRKGDPALAAALERFPLIHGAIFWPYINIGWSRTRRLEVIGHHYRLLAGRAGLLAHATHGEVELASLREEYEGLRLVIDKTVWFLREGEAVLNLFAGELRLYSLAFTLGTEHGVPVIYVGALQGSNLDQANDLYREVTRALHGLRPRDLLVTGSKMLARELSVEALWAVSNAARQHNSPYFGDSHKDKTLADYDLVWSEHGGVSGEDGFFRVPAVVHRRAAADIPSRKRAAYRRRYEMLDRIEFEIRAACDRYQV